MLMQYLLDLLFPRRSLRGREGELISSEEWKDMQGVPVIDSQRVLRENGLNSLDCIRAGSSYQFSPLLKKAICSYKYQHMPELTDALTKCMLRALPCEPFLAGATLCPVPLHWLRLNQRGFNQAELLARSIAAQRAMQMAPLLKRRRSTGHQAWRNRNERLAAMQNAFVYRGKTVPHTVVLIDDVATTGATLDACAQVLKLVGVQWVEGWVVARG